THRSSIGRKATKSVFRRLTGGPVSLLLEQTSGSAFSTQSTPIAPLAVISISVLPNNQNTARPKSQRQQVFPTSKEKISATNAISTRFEASKLITSPFNDIALDVGRLEAESARYRHHRASSFMLCGPGYDIECGTVCSQQPQRVLSSSARIYDQRFRPELGIERGCRGAPTASRTRQFR